jgi:hypothetical protein
MSIWCSVLRKEAHLSQNRNHLLKAKIFIRNYSLSCLLYIILVFPLQFLAQYNFFLHQAKFPLKSLLYIFLTLFIVIRLCIRTVTDLI